MKNLHKNQKGIAPLIIILVVVGVLVIGGGAAYYFTLTQRLNKKETNFINQKKTPSNQTSNYGINKIISQKSPPKKDSDNDGLTDDLEINYFKTDPNNADTDGDGYNDGEEVKSKNNPLGKSCTDSDGGLNQEVKGVTTGTNGGFTDSCDSDGVLKEYSCETTTVGGGDTSAYYDELLSLSRSTVTLNSNISIVFQTGKVISKEIKCNGKCLDGSCSTNNAAPTNSSANTSNSNVTMDETASWKILRDDQHGFEFKYPEDWIIEPNSSGIDLHQKSLEEIGGIGCAIHPNNGTGFEGEDTELVNGPAFFIYNSNYNSSLIKNISSNQIFRGFVDLPKSEGLKEAGSFEDSVTFEKSIKMPDGSFGIANNGLDDYCINKTKQILATFRLIK